MSEHVIRYMVYILYPITFSQKKNELKVKHTVSMKDAKHTLK